MSYQPSAVPHSAGRVIVTAPGPSQQLPHLAFGGDAGGVSPVAGPSPPTLPSPPQLYASHHDYDTPLDLSGTTDSSDHQRKQDDQKVKPESSKQADECAMEQDSNILRSKLIENQEFRNIHNSVIKMQIQPPNSGNKSAVAEQTVQQINKTGSVSLFQHAASEHRHGEVIKFNPHYQKHVTPEAPSQVSYSAPLYTTSLSEESTPPKEKQDLHFHQNSHMLSTVNKPSQQSCSPKYQTYPSDYCERPIAFGCIPFHSQIPCCSNIYEHAINKEHSPNRNSISSTNYSPAVATTYATGPTQFHPTVVSRALQPYDQFHNSHGSACNTYRNQSLHLPSTKPSLQINHSGDDGAASYERQSDGKSVPAETESLKLKLLVQPTSTEKCAAPPVKQLFGDFSSVHPYSIMHHPVQMTPLLKWPSNNWLTNSSQKFEQSIVPSSQLDESKDRFLKKLLQTVRSQRERSVRPFKCFNYEDLLGEPQTEKARIGRLPFDNRETYELFKSCFYQEIQYADFCPNKARKTSKDVGNEPPTSTDDDPEMAAYKERRRKNNEAAKRSRDARRAKEDNIAIISFFLRAVLEEYRSDSGERKISAVMQQNPPYKQQ